MFVRVKRSGAGKGAREYLQLVESMRDGKHVRQRVLFTLGRRDEVVADGTLDSLVQSLAKFSERLAVVDKVRTCACQTPTSRKHRTSIGVARWKTTLRMADTNHVLAAGARTSGVSTRSPWALAPSPPRRTPKRARRSSEVNVRTDRSALAT